MSTFKLPDLGEGLAEAEILEWHVKLGDHVQVDQPMLSVETAKAVVEIPVPYSGTVVALHGTVGDLVATGAPLIDFDSATVVGTMPATSDDLLIEAVTVGVDRTQGRHGNGNDIGNADVAGLGERRLRALPLARALAKQLGLDLSQMSGSGADGVVTPDDVMRYAAGGGHSSGARRLATPCTAPLVAPPGSAAEPLRGARRAMAHSMSLSRDQVSGSTVCDDANIHAWTQPSDYMLRLVRAMIAGCAAEPALNAWYDPVENSRILMRQVDLGIAVDTAAGLIVPVLRDIRDKTYAELRTAIAAQKAAAHSRSISREDLRDFTLMLSNFGTLAGRYGIPLVVPPAVAILGSGKVRKDAVVVGDSVLAHRRMPLSLSFDHRCITGGEACRFLAAVIADLEQAN